MKTDSRVNKNGPQIQSLFWKFFLLFVSRKNAPLARMPPGEVDFEGDHGARLHGGNKGLLIVSQRQVVYGCVALFQR